MLIFYLLNLLPDFFLSRFYITLCSPTPSGCFNITVAGCGVALDGCQSQSARTLGGTLGNSFIGIVSRGHYDL